MKVAIRNGAIPSYIEKFREVKRNKECLDGLKITQNKGPAHEWDFYSINEKGDPKTKA